MTQENLLKGKLILKRKKYSKPNKIAKLPRLMANVKSKIKSKPKDLSDLEFDLSSY